jgi:hypothetical protein
MDQEYQTFSTSIDATIEQVWNSLTPEAKQDTTAQATVFVQMLYNSIAAGRITTTNLVGLCAVSHVKLMNATRSAE